MLCSSENLLGIAYRYAFSGMDWWNAVSKTATCLALGKIASATSMPSRFAGLCKGANVERAFIFSFTV
jgi:hypothetical protein